MLKTVALATALALVYFFLKKLGTSQAATFLTVSAAFVAALIMGLLRDA